MGYNTKSHKEWDTTKLVLMLFCEFSWDRLGFEPTIFFFLMFALCCCVQAFSSCREWGLFSSRGVQASHCSGFSCGARALGLSDSGAAAHRLQGAGSVVAAHGLRCPEVCGIFPDQGSNQCPLHC